MSTAIKGTCSLLAAVFLTGCVSFPPGLIYSNTVVPYSARFDETPVGTKSCEISNYQVREPVSRLNMYAEWSTSFILEEARKAGITNIYYMDKKTLSILSGVFKHESLIVYGD